MTAPRWTFTASCKRCGDSYIWASSWALVMLVRFVRYAMRHGHCQYPPSPPVTATYYYRLTWIDKDGNELPPPDTASREVRG